jgi:6-phosphogluconolactonase/glucosamine-6-phosphate isomerase/deaminase
MKISKSQSREGAMRKAIDRLNECLRGFQGKPVLFMLSGGSALELLAGVEMKHIGKRVTIAALDERWSRDPAVNNFSQIAETDFYKKAERKGIDYIDTRIHRKISLYGLAEKLERGIKKWEKKYPNGKIIITQGIGEDGHVAGIMPYPEHTKKFNQLFEKEGRWVTGYNATRERSEYPKRVTVTLPFLRSEVDCSVVYVTGSKKKKALRSVLAKKGKLSKTPARVVRQMKNVYMFIDQAL